MTLSKPSPNNASFGYVTIGIMCYTKSNGKGDLRSRKRIRGIFTHKPLHYTKNILLQNISFHA